MREQLLGRAGHRIVNRRRILKVLLLVTVILTAGWLLWMFDVRGVVRSLLMKVHNLGPWAPFWFILIYVAGCVTMFPGIILTLSGGVLFGLVRGTLYVATGATLGATLAFVVSRYLARSFVEEKWGKDPRFRALDQAVAREGWKIVGLIRLSPVFPFTPTNFVFGLTRILLPHFFVVTWISILPLTTFFVYLGTLMGDLTQVTARPVPPGPMKWVIAGLGVVSTFIVTALVARITRRALAPQS